ncbi:MAG: geranylgeranylglycerol-phosphate geranylgeranyltransferase [Ignavibacteriaceae bacterium]|nr:geranylgeranylglycerol-phosphate geranylgeranyltransferase [Ignavibacteriaceae bacterium]
MSFKTVQTKINAIIRISRPVNVIITFISIIIAAVICSAGGLATGKIIITALSGGIAAAAGNIINDYYDIEIDKINRPDRPLVSKILTPGEAVFFFTVFSFLSIVLSFFVNFTAFIIDISALALLFIYSFKLKRTVLFGNITVAFLTGLAFIYGGVAVDNLQFAIIPAAFAFLINLIREIVKDMEDLEGDKAAGICSFPYLYGFKRSKQVITVFSILLIIATFIPFIYKFYRIEYFIIVMAIVNPVIVYSLKLLFNNDTKKNLNKISLMLKLDMLFGLIAIYLGK